MYMITRAAFETRKIDLSAWYLECYIIWDSLLLFNTKISLRVYQKLLDIFCEIYTAGELLESLRHQKRALLVTDVKSYFRYVRDIFTKYFEQLLKLYNTFLPVIVFHVSPLNQKTFMKRKNKYCWWSYENKNLRSHA